MTPGGAALISGALTFGAGLAVLVAGVLPPGLLATGQIDPQRWLVPFAVAVLVLVALLRRISGAWSVPVLTCAALALAAPPSALWVQGSNPVIAWAGTTGSSSAVARPVVGVLSGPPLYGSHADGGFGGSPLWRALSQKVALQPLDAIEPAMTAALDAMLVVQPRALAPDEMVTLDNWIRGGGHGVILADPELLWDDGRAMGHPLKPPRRSLLGPLLTRWGVELEPVTPLQRGSDPVERRFLSHGSLLQLAGTSRFRSRTAACRLAERALLARCAIGKGSVVLVADADFANDALWTAAPDAPGRTDRWTSDAPDVIAALLADRPRLPGTSRNWLISANGLSAALRWPLVLLLFFATMAGVLAGGRRTKIE